jgi:hypothetical protein
VQLVLEAILVCGIPCALYSEVPRVLTAQGFCPNSAPWPQLRSPFVCSRVVTQANVLHMTRSTCDQQMGAPRIKSVATTRCNTFRIRAWTWSRFRRETPSRYESYVDLFPDTWTKVRIEIRGAQAKLCVHGQSEPTLVVNDVKTGEGASGGVALWIGPGTVAHFRNLVVTP